MEPVHQCNLCRKTFKQKSSLVRHTKRCTLEPVPSVRQKACNNCITAKSRCDLKRPVCARCNMRGLSCAYMRPFRVLPETQETTSSSALVSADNSGSGSGSASGSDSVCTSSGGLASGQDRCHSRRSEHEQQIDDLDSENVSIENLAPDLCRYLDHETDFSDIVASEPRFAAHDCSLRHIFPGSASEPVTVQAPSNSKDDFHGFYNTPSNTTSSPHDGTSTDSYRSCKSSIGNSNIGPGGESGGGGAGTGTELPLVLRSNIEAVQMLSEEGGPDSPQCSDTAAMTTTDIQVDPWILELAANRREVNPPELVQHSSETLLRAFRSWPRMLAKGIQLPPIIHFLQFCNGTGDPGAGGTPKDLARCITLCKLWVGQADDSGQIVYDAVKREIDCIISKYREFDAPMLLAALQSIHILLVLLMFPSNRQASLAPLPAGMLTSIQQMGYFVLSTGMVLHEEATGACPPWRVWAHIEAKRRSLTSVYFLVWAYSVQRGLRHLNCLQLGRMPAPGPKYLWQATDERSWRALHARWLAQWDDGRVIVQAEFFSVDRGPYLDPRVEMWLEDADELGVLIMSILSAAKRDLSRKDGEGHIVG